MNRRMTKKCFITSVSLFVFGSIIAYIAYEDYRWTIVDDILTKLSNYDSEIEISNQSTHSNSHSYLVPNIVHYIWFGKNRTFSFINYISIVSAIMRQKPDQILFHCDYLPKGYWWIQLQKEVTLQIIHKLPPEYVGKQKIGLYYGYFHQADVAKLEVLMTYGGIYFDCDVIVINSLNPLRMYNMAIGREKYPKLIMGTILANKNAKFLRIWYETYKHTYRPFQWDYNAGTVSFYLFTRRPDLIHVEPYKLSTPDWTDRHLLFDTVINWHNFYVLHVMNHKIKFDYSPENIRSLNSTFGEVMRLIYYGSPALL